MEAILGGGGGEPEYNTGINKNKTKVMEVKEKLVLVQESKENSFTNLIFFSRFAVEDRKDLHAA